MRWNDTDLAQLKARHISPEEIERQLEFFKAPPSPPEVVAPCTVANGIVPIQELDRDHLHALFQREAAKGRFARFVPASGAATRMFKDLFDTQKSLEEWQRQGTCSNPFHLTFFRNIRSFPFYPALARRIAQQGHDPEDLLQQRKLQPFIDTLLSSLGLDYAKTPKGLIPFHHYGEEIRTPIEEHLWETAMLLGPFCSSGKVHFTVSPDWVDRFRDVAAVATRNIADQHAFHLKVDFSCQDPSTDTIAATPDNEPFRDDEGNLVFRPAGHGALIGNLKNTNYDLVLIKNIDNVVPESRQEDVNNWWQITGGLLVELEDQMRQLWQAIHKEDTQALEQAAAYLQKTFGYQPPSDKAGLERWTMERLKRPLRVCGMVRNLGEPGGGPFWVRTCDGVTRQIVELAQLNLANPDITQMVQKATHFNPVFMACALRDVEGKPLPLQDYIDPNAIILTEKTIEGRPVRALERPGLWNGAMAYWNTLFVEVPEEIFQPVKTVNDLLRPAHQTRQV